MPQHSRTPVSSVSDRTLKDLSGKGKGRRAAGGSAIPLALRTEFDDPSEVTEVYADDDDERKLRDVVTG